jgi:retron-type reverse transcriptase
MLTLRRLQNADGINDVAKLLGFKPRALSHILYVRPASSNYHLFSIPKRSGGTRSIAAPKNGLKLLQRRLTDLLQTCIVEINQIREESDEPRLRHQLAHGFVKDRSILTNARPHRNKRYVLNVDLEDFFGSIHFGRVQGFFLKDKSFLLKPKTALVLAQIACFEQKLPQGSPCSPIISNLISHILDIHLVRLASRWGCTYTRYADDLTFSSNKKEFPARIATRSCSVSHEWTAGSDLVRIIRHSGFRINQSKTRMQYHDSRQEVTGLVVNHRINVPSDYRRKVRAMAHSLFRTGKYYLPSFARDEDGAEQPAMVRGSLAQLHGMLGYIHFIDKNNTETQVQQYSTKDDKMVKARQDQREKIYRRFLFYKEFYALAKPLLLSEGWTDYIYIQTALKALRDDYPNLVSVDDQGRPRFAFRCLKYANSNTGKILQINGGTGEFPRFIHAYKREFEFFLGSPGMEHPVILLLDSDTGSTGVISTVKEMKKESISNKIDLLYVIRNLYIVFTPLSEGSKQSVIEDMFDQTTLSIKLNGKSFDRSSDTDSSIGYGKGAFARKIVEERASSINFNGFRPLLDRISLAVNTYYAQRH